jgi:hypothetical protein
VVKANIRKKIKMGEVKPISPIDAKKDAKSNIPDWVVTGINNAISANYRKAGFSILQSEIVRFILKESPNTAKAAWKKKIFDNGWMDFEPLFENVGWVIKYDKPGFNESYEPSFEFKPNTKTA